MNVVVFAGAADGALVPGPALWVVVGHGGDEDELELRHGSFDQAVHLDHSERVLPTVKAGDLGDGGTFVVDPVALQDSVVGLGRQLDILGAERVDGGRNGEALGPLQIFFGVVRAGEDSAVELAQVGLEQVPGLHLRLGQVDVAAPDPLAPGVGCVVLAQAGQESGRLWVMHDDEVVAFVEEFGVPAVLAKPGLAHPGRPVHIHALEAVMHRLGDLVELVGAADHLPIGGQANVVQQGHQRRQDLGHAAAE